MIAAWILFPILLLGTCLGCGLLLEVVLGRRLGYLLAPAGLAVVVVVGDLTTAPHATAPLTTPVAIALAVAGILLTFPWRGRRVELWPVAVALAVFAVYAAPVVLSGEPTFAGYIKLDDTATWLALTDRVMEHGRSLHGLAPSSYLATLEFNLAGGYPVGVFLPFGAGRQLVGGDLAWLFQPYLAFLAAMLSLGLWEVVGGVLKRPRPRALAVFVAAQPALLYGYSLWGGVKELGAALFIALAAGVAPAAIRRGGGPRDAVPLALACAALVGVLSVGGLVWLGPMLLVLAVLALRNLGLRAAVGRAVPFAVLLAVLATPVALAGLVPPTSSPLTDAHAEGNLRGPLKALQVLGIWPNGDFRFDPSAGFLNVVLLTLAVAAVGFGLWVAWRRRGVVSLLYATTLIACLAIVLIGSPWAGGKALATASPVALSLAICGAVALVAIDWLSGAVLVIAVAGGVLWSNALGYHDVSLAPYDQLRELQSIGSETAGQGPTLMTEYQPYGVRHFLREADAEGASELRARQVPLVEGGELEKGEWGDTDRISLPALETYRTLVLRRSPAQSRPPSSYFLVRRGDYYDVWQRPPSGSPTIAEHLPLGDFEDPAAVPSCAEVRSLARVAGPAGTLTAVRRRPNVVASLAEPSHPPSWVATETGSPELLPGGAGTARLRLRVPRRGRYGVYVQGSARNRLTVAIDGAEVGSVSEQLNESQQFLFFGDVALGPGTHVVTLELAGQDLGPGSGGPPEPIGPLVLRPEGAEAVLKLPASRAAELCAQRLDWVEAIR